MEVPWQVGQACLQHLQHHKLLLLLPSYQSCTLHFLRRPPPHLADAAARQGIHVAQQAVAGHGVSEGIHVHAR